jgi:hypothetical protein
MKNLEKAKQYLKDNFSIFHYKTAVIAVEIASNPDWGYIEKNEFPEKNKMVLCVCFSGSMAGFKFSHFCVGFYNGKKFNCEFDWISVVAWCELPVYNKA